MKKFTVILLSLFIVLTSLGSSQANERKDKYFARKCYWDINYFVSYNIQVTPIHGMLSSNSRSVPTSESKLDSAYSYWPIRKVKKASGLVQSVVDSSLPNWDYWENKEYIQSIKLKVTVNKPWGEKEKKIFHCWVYEDRDEVLFEILDSENRMYLGD